jgi:antitoxin component YwqK of YwqJK toxin-antitoxin module
MGGAKTFLESTMCMKVGTDGTRLYHGPFIAYWPDGSKQAEGQYSEGWRSGHWVFFDQHGVKTGETEFARGDYNGRRITYYPNGQIQMDETYDHGKQLSLKTFDQNGAAVAPAQLGVRATK